MEGGQHQIQIREDVVMFVAGALMAALCKLLWS
jgi:hypothetical protein